ncbi:MAG: MerR family DNA-binding transcriptional regulator [Synergistaceae bacterium]|nr:MerR family DNA-binding transcriptional regulator [Synergistaceae bacterium]
MKDQDMLTIKEFSKLTCIKQSKLRHYDEVKLFQPIKRGENGYRYYSAPQTIAVNLINVMHNVNIPIKKISEMKKQKSPESVLELLHKQELELNRELLNLHKAYAILHTYCSLIREGLLVDEKAINSRRMAAMPIELGPANDFSSGYFYDSFFNFIGQMSDRRIDPAYPAGGFYEDINAFRNAPGRPTRFFSVVPTGRDIREAGVYLVGYTRGYYGHLGDLPQRIQTYAKQHGFAFIGPVYEMYLHDEITVDDPEMYLIQASVQVKKRKSR